MGLPSCFEDNERRREDAVFLNGIPAPEHIAPIVIAVDRKRVSDDCVWAKVDKDGLAKRGSKRRAVEITTILTTADRVEIADTLIAERAGIRFEFSYKDRSALERFLK